MTASLRDFLLLASAPAGEVRLACLSYPACDDRQAIVVRLAPNDGSHVSLATVNAAAEQHTNDHHRGRK